MLNHLLIGALAGLSLFAFAWGYLRYRYSPILFVTLTTFTGGVWGYVWGYAFSGGDGTIEGVVAVFSALVGFQFGGIMWFLAKRQARRR